MEEINGPTVGTSDGFASPLPSQTQESGDIVGEKGPATGTPNTPFVGYDTVYDFAQKEELTPQSNEQAGPTEMDHSILYPQTGFPELGDKDELIMEHQQASITTGHEKEQEDDEGPTSSAENILPMKNIMNGWNAVSGFFSSIGKSIEENPKFQELRNNADTVAKELNAGLEEGQEKIREKIQELMKSAEGLWNERKETAAAVENQQGAPSSETEGPQEREPLKSNVDSENEMQDDMVYQQQQQKEEEEVSITVNPMGGGGKSTANANTSTGPPMVV